MAEKKINHLINGKPKTPRLQIFKEPDGEYVMTYAKSDPLNIRKVNTTNLDKEIQRLFGYEGWQQYKEENEKDLRKKIEKDPETGKITQAPTVHPFHVAYGLEEFSNNFDPKEYELVGVAPFSQVEKPEEKEEAPEGSNEYEPEFTGPGQDLLEQAAAGQEKDLTRLAGYEPDEDFTKEERKAEDIRTRNILNDVIQQRKNFFGDMASKSSMAKVGILNLAMFFPQEQLHNKDVVARAKKLFDFNKIYKEKFDIDFPVRHPNGTYWRAGFTSTRETVESPAGSLKINALRALDNSSMLTESKNKKQLLREFDPGSMGTILGFGLTAAEKAMAVAAVKEAIAGAGAAGIGGGGGAAGAAASSAFAAWALPVAAMLLAAGVGVTAGMLINSYLDPAGLKFEDLELPAGTVFFKDNREGLERWVEAEKIRIQTIKDKKVPYVGDPTGVIDVSPETVSTTTTSSDIEPDTQAQTQTSKDTEIDPDVTLADPKLTTVAVDDITSTDITRPYEPYFPATPDDLTYYILPINWRQGEWLTKMENVLSQRIGANPNFSINLRPIQQAAVDAPAEQETEKVSLDKVKALFFGHSQTGRLSSSLKSHIKRGGGQVVTKTYGVPDPGLAKEIKNTKGKFTHAYLYLNGNSYPPKAMLHKTSKKQIVDYVHSSLGVSKENILVILPPVNNASYEKDLKDRFKKEKDLARHLGNKKQAERSRRRGAELNPMAREYFKSLGIKVSDPIVSTDPADFGDGLHLSSASAVSKNFQAGEIENLQSESAAVLPTMQTQDADVDISNITGVKKIIAEVAKEEGVDLKFALAIAGIESGFQADSVKGQYHGLYQLASRYKNNEWPKYGLEWENVLDPRENTRTFLRLMKNNLRSMRAAGLLTTGLNPVDPKEAGVLYLTHQQGLRGIKEQIKGGERGAAYTDMPKDIQVNMHQNVYDSPKHLKGMTWREWRKRMGDMYRKMSEEARSLGLTRNKNWTRAWRELPENHPLYKEYASLANRYTVKRFVERWKSKAYRDYQKAVRSLGSSEKKIPEPVAAAPSAEMSTVEKPAKLDRTGTNYSYILGELGGEGAVYSKFNENTVVASGASMNKPILALVQLLKYKNDPEKKLNKKELDGLLAYTGFESNHVNRLISGRDPLDKRLKRRRATIGMISEADAREFLSSLGLDPNMKIRYGGSKANTQTARQFFDFMRLLHNEEKINSLGIKEEVDIILNYMKRNVSGVSMGGDRESRKWSGLIKKLRKEGVPIQSMYGKGGLIKSGLHYSFVINNKYLLSMYSDKGSTTEGSRARFYKKLTEILKDAFKVK